MSHQSAVHSLGFLAFVFYFIFWGEVFFFLFVFGVIFKPMGNLENILKIITIV